MKHRFLFFVILAALTLVSVMPVAAQDVLQGFPLTIVDGDGVEHTFEQPIERIACIDNACVETMAFLGVMPVAVGEFYNYNILVDEANFGMAAADVPQIPSDDAGNPDFEAIAELAPQLVVGWSDLREPLQGIAPVYAMHYQGDSIDTFPTDVRLLGRVLGLNEVAIEEKIDAAIDRLQAYSLLSPKDKSLYITGIADENGAFYNYDTTLFTPCGLISYVAQCGYAPGVEGDLSVEAVLSIDPDVIVIEEYDPVNNEAARIIDGIAANQPLWQELSAYQNETIFILPRTRARMTTIQSMVTVLDTVMPLMYPDIFPVPLTDEQVQEILAEEEAARGEYSITDVNGNTLTFDAPPTRFVSGGNRDIEMLAALGIVPAGVPDVPFLIEMVNNPVYFPQPVEFEIIPIDQETFEPDLEALLAFAPDVVFGGDELRAAAAGLDLNVYAFYANNGPGTWQQGLEELRKLAALTGREEQAEAIIAQFEDRLAAYAALAPRDRSVMLVGAASATEFYISTEVSGRCAIIREVATCPWPDPTGGESWSYVTNLEGILDLNPDVIILDNWGDWSNDEMNDALAASSLWNELTAVQTGRVTPILESYNYVQGVGPIGNMRWLDLYMPVIYPEVFPAPLTDEQVQEILAGEAVASGAQFPVTITDGSGAEYTFDAPVERIVCLSAGCQDNLFTLGLMPSAIASPMVTVHELLHGSAPAETITLINMAGGLEPDIEQIVGFQPDVVIATLGLHDFLREALESTTDIPVLLEYPRTVEETFASLRMTANITGTSTEAEAAIQHFEDRMNAYAALAPGDATVAIIFAYGSLDATYVEAADAQNCLTFTTYGLAACPIGLPENSGPFSALGYEQFTFEGMLDLNPDVLLFSGYDDLGITDPAILEAFSTNPLWDELDAVQNDRVYSIDSWVFSGQGGLSLLGHAMDTAMTLIYPDIFPDGPLTDVQVTEILAGQ